MTIYRALKGWVKPRPIRIAFLVQDAEHAHLILDGIFADCYSRWGGRFSLVVPCVDQRIHESYWPWLEAFDPDIVYSYVSLSRDDILAIHERLGPSQYAFHKKGNEPRLDIFGFKPRYEQAPLSSMSTIFKLARHRGRPGSIGGIRVMDRWHGETPSRFLTDNFGTYHFSYGTSMYPRDATAAGQPLTVVSPEAQADRRYGAPSDLDVVATEMDAVEEFAKGGVTSLSILSSLFAPKLTIQHGVWSESFNLVVGDTFADRILFWNARLLIPAWLDADLCCLRVDFEQIKDPAFRNILGAILRQRNHVTAGTGGQSRLVIRSASLNAEQMREAHELLVSANVWGSVTCEAAVGIDAVVPPREALRAARQYSRFDGDLAPRPDWSEFTWSPPVAHPPSAAPDHVSDAPIRQSFTMGCWYNDFALEYDGPGPSSAPNLWMLPRRWRMARAFKVSRKSRPSYGVPPSVRTSRDGRLSVSVDANSPIDSLEVPTAADALRYALAVDGLWADADAEHERVYPTNKVSWTDPSNEARYLAGVLGMAGGHQRASQFLLHPFLRRQFAKLGGTPNLPVEQLQPTVNKLQKRVKQRPVFDLTDCAEREALAELIVKAARAVKRPMEFVKYEDLRRDWEAYRTEYHTGHPSDGADSSVDWTRLEEESLDTCLMELRHRQIMFQGHRWTCERCHHKNWLDFSALSSELTCEVCKHATRAPVKIEWLFRPSEFLIESLRDHSVLSLIWVLSALRREARSSFIFVEPTWFGFSGQHERPDAEADLLFLLDGRAVLCEAKSSWTSLRQSDVEQFVELSVRLRPDIALLAVMEVGPARTIDAAAVKNRLAGHGIEFRVLTPERFSVQDDPYLSFDDAPQ